MGAYLWPKEGQGYEWKLREVLHSTYKWGTRNNVPCLSQHVTQREKTHRFHFPKDSGVTGIAEVWWSCLMGWVATQQEVSEYPPRGSSAEESPTWCSTGDDAFPAEQCRTTPSLAGKDPTCWGTARALRNQQGVSHCLPGKVGRRPILG